MKKGWLLSYLVVFSFLLLFFASFSFANTLNGLVSGIPNEQTLKVTVINNNKACSGICTINFETNGEYTTNLDYNEGDALTIYSYYEDVLNSNTETADYVPYDLNLSICTPPQEPQLLDIGTVTTPSVELQWVAPDADYSAVSVDGGNYYEQESPYTISSLLPGNHTWLVKTCNTNCCAKEVGSSFVVSDNLPSPPKFQTSSKGLEISKGTDSDSYVEYSINNQTPVKSDFFDINNMSIEARTCNSFGCSDWTSKKIIACQNAGNFIGISLNNSSDASSAAVENGPDVNYSDFFSQVRGLMQSEPSTQYSSDLSCASQVSQGVNAIKEVLSTNINELNSFVVNTNVPSTVKVGDDVVVNVDFKSDKTLENVTFSIDSDLSFNKKDFDIIVNGDEVNARLTAPTSRLNDTTHNLVLKISDFEGPIYTKQYTVNLLYTMSDFDYRLQELRLQSKGIFDALTSSLVIISVFFVCVVLFFYMRLKNRYKKEMITEAKLQKDRDLALSVLAQKQDVDALKKEETKEPPKLNIDDLKKEAVIQKTDYEKKVDKIEESRAPYLQKNDERKNTFFEGK